MKTIPNIICFEETTAKMDEKITKKHVTPTAQTTQNKRFKQEQSSVNTGGVEEAPTDNEYSIQTGMDLAVTEKVQLLEIRVESLENERKLLIKDVAALTKKIADCKEEQSHAWECRNKFIGLHNEKLEAYIAKLQAYTCKNYMEFTQLLLRSI